MKKKNIEPNKKTLQILNCIRSRENLSTANEISKETGIAYVTVRKYLEKLMKTKIIFPVNKKEIQQGEKSKSIYYSIDYDYLNSKRV